MKPMTIALCLCLGALACALFMRIATGAEPCQVAEDDLNEVDADSAYQLIDYRPSKEMRELKAAIDEADAAVRAERAASDRAFGHYEEALGAYRTVGYQPNDGLRGPFADAAPVAKEAAPAASVSTPDPTEDPGAFATAVIAAAKAGKWLALGGLMLVGLIALARFLLVKKWSWFGTDKGGAVTTLGVTFLTVLSSSMAAGIFDWTVIMPAAATFVAGAVALYVLPKKMKSQF